MEYIAHTYTYVEFSLELKLYEELYNIQHGGVMKSLKLQFHTCIHQYEVWNTSQVQICHNSHNPACKRKRAKNNHGYRRYFLSI